MRICASNRHPATLASATFVVFALMLTSKSALAGTLKSIKLWISGKEVALNVPAVYDGHEVYLPLEALNSLGATYTLGRRDETALVALPNGLKTEIALARPGKAPMLPLSSLSKPLGIVVTVQDDTCTIRKEGERPPTPKPETHIKPEVVKPAHDKAPDTIVQKAPVTPASSTQVKTDNPALVQKKQPVESALTVNLPPAKFPAQQPTNHSAAPGTTVALSNKNVPANTTAPQNVQAPGGLDNGSKPVDAGVSGPFVGPPDLSSRGTTGLPPQALKGPLPIRIEEVAFETTGPQTARIRIKTTGKAIPATKLLGEPSRLAIDVPNSVLEGDQRDWSIQHPFLNGIHAKDGETPGTTRIVLDLSRLISYRVLPPDADGVTVNLGLPRGVGRKMSELVVVVDAGHGGSEGKNPVGCSVVNGGICIMEKNLTLSIARRVQKLLEDEGTTVLMTRTKDVSVSLTDRPKLAIQNNADLFVSIHIDDCPRPNSASGTTAYYSKDDPNGRALAHSLVENIAAVSGLPNRRARSDRERFAGTGMAVLHTGVIPSTLVEIGYINNVKDRTKLINSDFQDTIAQAIVDGVRGYVEASLPENVAGPISASMQSGSR